MLRQNFSVCSRNFRKLSIVFHLQQSLLCSLVEVVEHCCSITSLQLGETMTSVAKDMDTLTYRYPLGVCAGITPFNFPAMIPLWVRFDFFYAYRCHRLNVAIVYFIY